MSIIAFPDALKDSDFSIPNLCDPSTSSGCGHGVCDAATGAFCVCEPGYAWDLALVLYPTCYKPSWFQPFANAWVAALSIVTAAGGIYRLWNAKRPLKKQLSWTIIVLSIVLAGYALSIQAAGFVDEIGVAFTTVFFTTAGLQCVTLIKLLIESLKAMDVDVDWLSSKKFNVFLYGAFMVPALVGSAVFNSLAVVNKQSFEKYSDYAIDFGLFLLVDFVFLDLVCLLVALKAKKCVSSSANDFHQETLDEYSSYVTYFLVFFVANPIWLCGFFLPVIIIHDKQHAFRHQHAYWMAIQTFLCCVQFFNVAWPSKDASTANKIAASAA